MRRVAPPAWPFGGLEPGAYDLLLADPPWRFETYSERGELKSASQHYATQGLEWIASLPVAALAKEDSVLVMWTTKDQLRNAFAVLDAWEFEYKTCGAWGKRAAIGGGWAFGTGYYWRGCVEYFLLATRGKGLGIPKARSIRDLIEARVREHSRKPEAMRANLEAMWPEARRAELFAREPRAQWEAWGNEVQKFEPPRLLV